MPCQIQVLLRVGKQIGLEFVKGMDLPSIDGCYHIPGLKPCQLGRISLGHADTRELLPVSSYDEVENCYYATLTELTLENGVVQRVLPSLNNLETDRLTQSIQTIKRNYLEI